MTALQQRECRACGAPIVFAGTVKGKAMPVDVEPKRGGNVRLVDRDGLALAEVLGPMEVELAAAEGELLHFSHFATCPHADRFR